MRTLLSFGDFYLGTDETAFTDVSIHVWKFRLEFGGPKPIRSDGTLKEAADGSEDVSPIEGDQLNSST